MATSRAAKNTAEQMREVHGLSDREQRRYWGFRQRRSHGEALQCAMDAERYSLMTMADVPPGVSPEDMAWLEAGTRG